MHGEDRGSELDRKACELREVIIRVGVQRDLTSQRRRVLTFFSGVEGEFWGEVVKG
jgi:hypothetical protein